MKLKAGFHQSIMETILYKGLVELKLATGQLISLVSLEHLIGVVKEDVVMTPKHSKQCYNLKKAPQLKYRRYMKLYLKV